MRSVRAILANARRYPGSFVLHLLCAVASVFVAAAHSRWSTKDPG
mgnify:CR=1 FL=1